MNLITPDAGLLFWMVLIFGIVFFLLAKFGFPVITEMVEKRSRYIGESLKLAQEAEERMKNFAAEQQSMLEETRDEQNKMLREATQTRNKIIEQAKMDALATADKLISKAKIEIAAEKESALKDIRKEMALFSIDIAEKIVRKELDDDKARMQYIDTLINEMSKKDNSIIGS